MKRNYLFILTVAFVFNLMSCSAEFSVAAKKDGTDFAVKTSFDSTFLDSFKELVGIDKSQSLFDENDFSQILKILNFTDISSAKDSENKFSSKGFLSSIEMQKLGFIKLTENSISITLGPKEFEKIYENLDENSKSYFDMLIIPALIGEKMTFSEYKEILASMYGKKFADEITEGKISIKLCSPDRKKTEIHTEKIGEILSLSEEKVWSLSW